MKANQEKLFENYKYNKKNSGNKFLTYANKLDNFMTSTNYKFNNMNNNRNKASFAESELGKNFWK